MAVHKTCFPEDHKNPVEDWLEHKQDLHNLARANLKRFRERESTRRATFKVGALELVQNLRLP